MHVYKSQREAAIRRQNKGPPYKFLVPLIYAPVLPLSKSSIYLFIFFTYQVLNFFVLVELDHVSFMGFGYSMCLVYGCFEFFQFDSP